MTASDSDEDSWQGLTCTREFVFNGVNVNVQEHWGTSIGAQFSALASLPPHNAPAGPVSKLLLCGRRERMGGRRSVG